MPSIADFWVELHTEGAEEAQTKLSGIQKAAKSVEDATRKMTSTFEKMGEGIKKSFLAAQASIAGFAVAGFTGTIEGERLAFQFQQLSREIAGIFLPAMEKLIEYVRSAVDWFRGLTGAQQDNLAKWALWIAGVTAGVKVLNMFGLTSVIAKGAIIGLTAALNAMGAASAATALKTEGVGALIAKTFGAAIANPMAAAIVAIVGVTAALTTMLVVMGRAATLGEKLEASMKRMKGQGFTEKEVEKSRVADFAKDDRFKNMSKDDQKKFLDQQEQEAKDRLAIAQGYVDKGPNAKAEFKKNVAEGRVGEKQATQALADVEIAQKLKAQLEKTGKTDVDALIAGNEHRRPTEQTGGFESLSSSYSRIQEGIMKSAFDPAQAHTETKDIGMKQIDILGNIVAAVKNINVGANN